MEDVDFDPVSVFWENQAGSLSSAAFAPERPPGQVTSLLLSCAGQHFQRSVLQRFAGPLESTFDGSGQVCQVF